MAFLKNCAWFPLCLGTVLVCVFFTLFYGLLSVERHDFLGFFGAVSTVLCSYGAVYFTCMAWKIFWMPWDCEY